MIRRAAARANIRDLARALVDLDRDPLGYIENRDGSVYFRGPCCSRRQRGLAGSAEIRSEWSFYCWNCKREFSREVLEDSVSRDMETVRRFNRIMQERGIS